MQTVCYMKLFDDRCHGVSGVQIVLPIKINAENHYSHVKSHSGNMDIRHGT